MEITFNFIEISMKQKTVLSYHIGLLHLINMSQLIDEISIFLPVKYSLVFSWKK